MEIVGDNVVFTPTLNFNGTASFDYTLSDGNGGTVTETVMIDVAPVNDAPVTDADAATATKDTALVILAADLLDDDTDVDGDTLVLQSVGNATNGDVAIDGSGNVVFTPTTGFTGAATFDYTVSDGQGGTATQEVSVTVAAPPEAIASAAKVQPGEAASWKLTGAGGAEGLTYTLESYAGQGQVDVFADGTYTYTPSAEFTGTESFDFRVTDANGVFSVSTVSVDAGSGEGTLVYATLSATEGNVALTEGDMQAALSGSSDYVYGTQMMDGGKWYFEWDVISNANGPEVGFSRAGNTGPGSTTGDRILLSTTAGAIPGRNGVADTFGGTTTWNNKGGTAAGANTGRYMAAIDIDTGKVWFGIPNANGTGQDLWFPSSSLGSNDTTTGTAAGWTTFDETAPTYTNANAIPNQEWFIYATSSVPGEAIKIYTDRSDWLGSAPTTEFEAVATVEGGGVVFNPTAGGDYLEGSADANVIDGQAGDDKLIGNGGADTLTGGAGDDTYSFGRGDGADLIDNIGEGASADKVKFGATIDTDQLWFRQVGNDLVVDVIGTTDSVTVDEWTPPLTSPIWRFCDSMAFRGGCHETAWIFRPSGSYATSV